MKNKDLANILSYAFYEDMKRELSALPSDEELRCEFPITEKKRDKFIKRLYGKKKPMYISYLQRVAVFLLVFSAISFGVMMANPEIRADILEKGIKLFNEYIQFDFSEDKSDYTVDFDNIEIGYIPKGYGLYFSSCYEGAHDYVYTNAAGYVLSIDISNHEYMDTTQISDTFFNLQPITIDGFNGYTSYDPKDNCSLVVWGNDNFQIYICGTLELDEALNIAYSIKY